MKVYCLHLKCILLQLDCNKQMSSPYSNKQRVEEGLDPLVPFVSFQFVVISGKSLKHAHFSVMCPFSPTPLQVSITYLLIYITKVASPISIKTRLPLDPILFYVTRRFMGFGENGPSDATITYNMEYLYIMSIGPKIHNEPQIFGYRHYGSFHKFPTNKVVLITIQCNKSNVNQVVKFFSSDLIF